jgi:hypothetical protein
MIEQLIEQALANAVEPSSARRISAWNAGMCVRRLWYGEHGVEPTDAESSFGVIRRFLGEQIEQLLVTALDITGLSLPGEQLEAPSPFPSGRRIYTDLNLVLDERILGSATGPKRMRIWDAPQVSVVLHTAHKPAVESAVPIVVPADVKSIGQFQFERLLAGDFSDYEDQLEVYMRAKGVPLSIVIGCHRDSSKIIFGIIPSTDARWEKIKGNISVAMADELPERPYEKKENYPCGYCPYRSLCWSPSHPSAAELIAQAQGALIA